MATPPIQLTQQGVQITPINNQLMVGKKGPLAVRLIMDFTQTNEYDLDLQNTQATAQFDLCQTIYVDNSAGGAPLSVVFPDNGQTIVVKAGTQGYYNVMCPNPIRIQFLCSGGQIITVFLINIAIPGAVWPTQ